jgi:hypothetical protein
VTPVVSARKSSKRSAKASVQGRKLCSGGGSNLPAIPLIRWEENRSGGVEAWYSPPGATKRSDRTYLGYIGKRLIDQIGTGPDGADRIRQIVSAKMTEKGIAP